MEDSFKIQITASELRDHFKRREAYHGERAESLVAAANEVKIGGKGAIGDPDAFFAKHGIGHLPQYFPGGPGGVVEFITHEFERRIRGHRAGLEMFEFYRVHLMDVVYKLTPRECAQLELVNALRVAEERVDGMLIG